MYGQKKMYELINKHAATRACEKAVSFQDIYLVDTDNRPYGYIHLVRYTDCYSYSTQAHRFESNIWRCWEGSFVSTLLTISLIRFSMLHLTRNSGTLADVFVVWSKSHVHSVDVRKRPNKYPKQNYM